MTNSAKPHARRAALGFLLALALAGGCGVTHDESEPSSSGSHWLTCKRDQECTTVVAGARCDGDGVCVDRSGARIRDPNAGSSAGSSSVAGGGSGSGSGSGGASASGSPSAGSGSGGSGNRIDAGVIDAGMSGGSSVEAGVGVVLPDCGSLSVSAGGNCTVTSAAAVPECCSASTHLRCQIEGCTGSVPGSCRGTFEPQVGSKLCGGYQPCAGKQCGDACTLCEPGDPSCVEDAVLKRCDRTNACVATTPDCRPPPSCDPTDVNSCGAGKACCAVGRCGPLETGEGICEDADPVTGECIRCACESQPGGCPICNSPDTPIATPDGERPVADLREGDLVLSMHRGQLVAVPVLATRSVQVFNHAVVHLVLDNGRSIEVSGSHPMADGRRLDALQPGEALGGLHVQAIALVPYQHERTYDILPASDTGTYLAGGALIGSTLFER